jgi:hypothetical protein
LGELPNFITASQTTELLDAFIGAVMSAGIRKRDIADVSLVNELGLTLVLVRVYPTGISLTNVAIAAEVLLMLYFQVTVDNAFIAVPTSVGLCQTGACKWLLLFYPRFDWLPIMLWLCSWLCICPKICFT